MSESPSRASAHVVRPLTNILIAEMQRDDAYICTQIFPSVKVEYQSDLFYSMPKDPWFRTVAEDRAPATESVGVTYQLDPNNRYDCAVKAVHFDLADQTKKNYSTPLDAEKGGTMIVTSNIKLRRELDFQQTYLRKGQWAGFLGAGGVAKDFDCSDNTVSHGQWDLASSDPIMDVEYLQSFMMSQTGQKPETLTVAKNVYSALKNHPAFIDRIKYSQLGVNTKQLMAEIFDIKKFIVAEAILNSAQEGQPARMGFMATNCFLLSYAPDTPELMMPSAGYVFEWTGYDPSTGLNAGVTVFRMQHLRADRIEAEIAYDMKVVCPDCGIFGINVLSKV